MSRTPDDAPDPAILPPAPAAGQDRDQHTLTRRRVLGGAVVLGGALGIAMVSRRLAVGQAEQPRQPYRGTLRWIGHC